MVLLGPAHYHPVHGVAVSGAESFQTPLGRVPVDAASIRRALEFVFVRKLDAAFEREHSLEVHLPFLMRVLPRFALVPLLVGKATPTEIDTLLEALWGRAGDGDRHQLGSEPLPRLRERAAHRCEDLGSHRRTAP